MFPWRKNPRLQIRVFPHNSRKLKQLSANVRYLSSKRSTYATEQALRDAMASGLPYCKRSCASPFARYVFQKTMGSAASEVQNEVRRLGFWILQNEIFATQFSNTCFKMLLRMLKLVSYQAGPEIEEKRWGCAKTSRDKILSCRTSAFSLNSQLEFQRSSAKLH